MHPLAQRLLSLDEDHFHNGPPRPPEEIEELEREVGARFPDDYRAVLLEVGPCGIAGPEISLIVDLIEDVMLAHTDELWNERMPGSLMFGGDGGDYAYYFDLKNRLGFGKFAIFFVEKGTLTFGESRFVAATLSEAIDKVLAGENFRTLPKLEN